MINYNTDSLDILSTNSLYPYTSVQDLTMSSPCVPTYALNNVPGFASIISASPNDRKQVASTLNIKCFQWNYKNRKNYTIIKYDKKMLATMGYASMGLLRSVIIDEAGKVLCFAPPKSLPESTFEDQFGTDIREYGSSQEVKYKVEEFVDGTMINAFYDTDLQSWQIATRSSVGAEISFYMEKGFKPEDTFNYMFFDICKDIKFDINTLDKDLVYSFVMQHPCNRIVKPIKEKSLFLVEVYRVHNEDILNQYISVETNKIYETVKKNMNLKYPVLYGFDINGKDDKRIEEVKNAYASKNTRYDIVGIFIKDNLGNRFKYRNPNYNYVKKLRGNNPKLQFQYLHLRKYHLVTQYLMYYPEHTELFDGFQKILHDYTRGLYDNYVACFILKKGSLGEYPEKYQNLMKDVHRDIYLNRLMHTRERMTLSHVIEYVNNVPPAKLMFLTNFDMRRNTIQDHVFTHKALVDSTGVFTNSIDTTVIDDELKPVSMVS